VQALAAASLLGAVALVALTLAPATDDGATPRDALTFRAGVARAQATARVIAGGGRARSGVHPLRAGFTPDPFQLRTRAGGPIHAAALQLGPGCRGYVSAEPDVIVRFSGASTFLRLFVRATSDVTLVVNDPNGRFLCNDDVLPGRDTNPMVDVYQPRPGQYDVWIGAHGPGEEVDATLFVTELRTQRP
jgi:hypothetical protein